MARLLVLVLLLLAPLLAGAQEMLWSLDRYPLDMDAMGRTFKQKNLEQGLVPVGIESNGETITVLSLHNSRLGAKSWRLQSYADFELFKKALTQGIQEGFTPVDVSFEKDRLYVLFLELEATPEDWAWVVSPPSAAEIRKVTDPLIEKGYQPVGITMVDGTFATLMVRFKNRSLRSWTLAVAPGSDGVTEQMRQRLAQGELPCGLLTGTNATNIVFLSWAGDTPAPAVASGASDLDAPPTEEEPMTLQEIGSFIFDNYVQPSPP